MTMRILLRSGITAAFISLLCPAQLFGAINRTISGVGVVSTVVTGPSGDVNNTGQGGLGYVIPANDPRMVQIALKPLF
jgi:hypothetical protein